MPAELSQRIQHILSIDPTKGAIEFKQQWYSWEQLKTAMDALNAIFEQAQLPTGAAIAIVLRNRPAHVTALLQTMLSDRCIVPINPFQSADKIATDLEHVNAPIILADQEDWLKPEIAEFANRAGAVAVSMTDATSGDISIKLFNETCSPALENFCAPKPDTAILMLTSGTTGPAKRIQLSYASFEQSVMGAIRHYSKANSAPQLKRGVSLLSGPLVHIGGMYFIFDSIASGRAFCLLEKFNVHDWVTAVKQYKIKVASIPPTAIRMVLEAGTPKEDLASLVCIRSGSAPLPYELQENFEALYGIPLLDIYGATEFSGAIAGWTIEDHQQYSKMKRGSVGRAQPGVELRVINPEDDQELPLNTVGLLEVRSKQASNADWVRTTDLAELDEDGFLFIRGRADNAIIRGGFKILPLEVEELIMQHPAVKTAAVLGIEDHRLGAVPVAGVELESGCAVSEVDLQDYIRQHTVSYKVPTHIKVMTELPRTPSMKVSIHELKKHFLAESA